jgi:hypothetical protein
MTPTRIQIRLQHQAGQRLDEVWAIVSPSLPLTAHTHAHHTLTLPLLGSGQATPQISWNHFGWTLSNRTVDACIYVNGQTLEPSRICHIAIGDVLEIGLCRFVIEAAQDSEVATTSTLLPISTTPTTNTQTNLSIDTFMESLTAAPHIIDSDAFESLPITPVPTPSLNENTEIIDRLNDAYLQALQDSSQRANSYIQRSTPHAHR